MKFKFILLVKLGYLKKISLTSDTNEMLDSNDIVPALCFNIHACSKQSVFHFYKTRIKNWLKNIPNLQKITNLTAEP